MTDAAPEVTASSNAPLAQAREASPEGNEGEPGAATSLLLPATGEVIDLEKPDQCVRALAEVRALQAKLKEVASELTFYLSQEFQRQGTKTMQFENVRAELKGGSELVWDVEILEQLLELGLPEERYNELVRPEITYKVSAREAQRIAAANPAYAEVIERAKQSYTKPAYVSIKT